MKKYLVAAIDGGQVTGFGIIEAENEAEAIKVESKPDKWGQALQDFGDLVVVGEMGDDEQIYLSSDYPILYVK